MFSGDYATGPLLANYDIAPDGEAGPVVKDCVKCVIMESKIPATRLARGLGDILGRIRYRGESFLIERNGVLVARIGPVAPTERPRLGEVVRAWGSVEADPEFARDLEAISAADTPAHDPWD